MEIRLDARVLAFTLIVSVVAGLLFGLAPAFRAVEQDGSLAVPRANRMRGGLVAAETALSIVLLVTAGLVAKSFARLQAVSPGFDPERLLTTRISLPPFRYSDRSAVIAFFDKLTPKIAAIPGVEWPRPRACCRSPA